MRGKLVFKIQTRPQQRSMQSPAKMSKVLDFLADNDHDELDSNGATLEAGPLPESTSPPMTISSLTALLSTPAQPWKLVLSLSPLALQSWLRLGPLSFPKLCGSNCLIMRGSHATPSYTEYSVHFGQVFFSNYLRTCSILSNGPTSASPPLSSPLLTSLNIVHSHLNYCIYII